MGVLLSLAGERRVDGARTIKRFPIGFALGKQEGQRRYAGRDGSDQADHHYRAATDRAATAAQVNGCRQERGLGVALAKCVKRRRDLGRDLIPFVRVLFHHLSQHADQFRRYIVTDCLDRSGLLFLLFHEHVKGGDAFEGRPAGDQEIESTAEAVDIGADVGIARVDGLLGRHEMWSAHDGAFLRQGVGADVGGLPESRQPQIEHLHGFAVIAGKQVVRFHIAVNEAALPSVFEPQRRLSNVVGRHLRRKRTAAAHQPGKVHPVRIFHHEQ
jgi:hypothetical protein